MKVLMCLKYSCRYWDDCTEIGLRLVEHVDQFQWVIFCMAHWISELSDIFFFIIDNFDSMVLWKSFKGRSSSE